MKKICLILMLFIPMIVFGKEYSVDELNFKVDVNDNYVVFTRDNLENNQDLTSFNLTSDQMKTIMLNGNIYMDIINKNMTYEILFIVLDSGKLEINNSNNYSDDSLEETAKSYAKSLGTDNYSIYKANQKFIVVDYYDSKTGYYIINYYTIANNKGYNFQMQKQSSFTSEEKASLKEMVDTIKIKELDEFKTEPIPPKTYEKKGIDWSLVFRDALIGGIIGGVAGGIGALARKKKNKETNN